MYDEEQHLNENPTIVLNGDHDEHMVENANKEKSFKLVFTDVVVYVSGLPDQMCIDCIEKCSEVRRLDLYIPDSFSYEGVTYTITELSAVAFMHCDYIETLKLPNFITRIERWSFSESGFREIILPEHLEFIGGAAFWECSVGYLEIPESVTTLGQRMCTNSGLEEIWIKNEDALYSDYDCDRMWEERLSDGWEWWKEENGLSIEDRSDEDYDDEDDEESDKEKVDLDCGIKYMHDGEEISEAQFYAYEAEYEESLYTIPIDAKIYVGPDKKPVENPCD